MELKLTAHLSYIDKYNKLKFIYIDGTDIDKLKYHCERSTERSTERGEDIGKKILPYNDDDFTVCFDPIYRKDMEAFIGLDCNIRVKLCVYNFISKLSRNKGDKVQGVRLILTDIQRI